MWLAGYAKLVASPQRWVGGWVGWLGGWAGLGAAAGGLLQPLNGALGVACTVCTTARKIGLLLGLPSVNMRFAAFALPLRR